LDLLPQAVIAGLTARRHIPEVVGIQFLDDLAMQRMNKFLMLVGSLIFRDGFSGDFYQIGLFGFQSFEQRNSTSPTSTATPVVPGVV